MGVKIESLKICLKFLRAKIYFNGLRLKKRHFLKGEIGIMGN